MSPLSVTSTVLLETTAENLLQPLSVSLSFVGEVPYAFRHRKIPIYLTVSMVEPLADHTFPVISVEPCAASVTDGVEHAAIRERDLLKHSLLSMPITFLPLPTSFDRHSQRHWAALSQRIADWLVSVDVDSFSDVWKWGRDAFWISFVAAYPSFPDGDWPAWPCAISLDGTFICYWIKCQQSRAAGGVGEGDLEGEGNSECEDVGRAIAPVRHQQDIPVLMDVHAELWGHFRQHLSIFYDL